MDVRIDLHGVKVGPDEVLVIPVPEDWSEHAVNDLAAALESVGLRERFMVIVGASPIVVKK